MSHAISPRLRAHRGLVALLPFLSALPARAQSAAEPVRPAAELAPATAPAAPPAAAGENKPNAAPAEPAAALPEAPAAPAAEGTAAAAPAATTEPQQSEQFATTTDESEITDDGAPKLEFYGFGDFNYINLLSGKDSTWAQFVAPKPTFYVGHLNLYLASSLGKNWRSLAEVRFTYAPLFDEDPGTGTSFTRKDTTASDYADVAGDMSWSGIEMQRAWIEYQPLDFLTVRAGQWLTPYGYWNDDHGSPTILGVVRPFPINMQLFPERQTGLEAYGKFFVGDWALGYFLTLSNGRGPTAAIRDLDNNKAIGGRLVMETSAYGDLSFGISAYRGKYTASTKHFSVDVSKDPASLVIYRVKDSAYQELSLGADVRWSWSGLRVQAEVMMNEAAYDQNARPQVQGFDPRPAFFADYRRWGSYALLGYTLPWFELTPYVMGEHTSFTDSDVAPPVASGTVGLNLRATPNVVLKTEFKQTKWYGPGSLGLGNHSLRFIGAQVAWAF